MRSGDNSLHSDSDTAITVGEPESTWLANYRGGWQTLVPVAGPARDVDQTRVGFHGEASTSAWTVREIASDTAVLSLELTSVPVSIDRRVSLGAHRIEVADLLTNRDVMPVQIDYVSHPAFGGRLLDGTIQITTGAGSFNFDPDTANEIAEPGSHHLWRNDTPTSALEKIARFSEVDRQNVLGWLEGFEVGWAAIENRERGLTVRVDWDPHRLPFAWLWQELKSSEGFPWNRQVRAVAIEPASCQSGGTHRASTLVLSPGQPTEIAVGISVKGTKE